ncbi:hypothetical protein KO528_08885 [Saccharophagus degradans]|uniref:hypothetical protein n=1 Tax=Saccharophagus degradans TaxID=86304 RepID=UPI001C07F0D8|nr:hypothetical protein [Saccharophagus degradans]MBU2985466.1 hypothetical protein [Saccharophagus degradans]
MERITLSQPEKLELIRELLGKDHPAAGRNFAEISILLDKLGFFNDVVSIAEIIPSIGTILSSSKVGTLASNASFLGTIFFPLQQIINLVNANETGLRMYSYRATSYAATAWAFDKAIPAQSNTVLTNISSGSYVATNANSKSKYNQVWRESSQKTVTTLQQSCIKLDIKELHMKLIFRAAGDNRPEVLCANIQKNYEKEFNAIVRNSWVSNYKISYPN